MAKIKVLIHKNTGEVKEVELDSKDYKAEEVISDMRDSTVDSVVVGKNIYKKHAIQSIEVE